MAEVKPFNVVRYSDAHVSNLTNLITPPYDVISPAEQDEFHRASEFNIIRLVLGKQFPDDTPEHDKYTRARDTLRQWLESGALVKDDKPSFTVYRMEFEHPEGGTAVLDGIIALVKVDEYAKGKVLPHEKTYKGPKLDQLKLMRACRANFTPIHGLYDDRTGEIDKTYRGFLDRPADLQSADAQGTTHSAWIVRDEAALERISELLRPESLVIADGHHRYETALAFHREAVESGEPESGPHGWVLMYLTSMSHPGLTILPAHRMVKGLEKMDVQGIEDALAPFFTIEQLCFDEDNREEVSATLVQRIRNYSEIGGKFGMVLQGERCFRLLKLRDFSAVESLMAQDIPSSLRGLDVTILREIIMSKGLGMDVENSEGMVEYTPLIADALEKARRGDVRISFILNPTRVDQMRRAAELGHKLPHKSTYFFPKLSSGFVLNVFDQP